MDRVIPPGEKGRGARSVSSASRTIFFVTGSAEEAAYLEGVRERYGDEVADRWQRSRGLRGQPRPLSETERARLRDTMAPVLRDIEASGASPLIIQEEAYEAVDDEFASVTAWHSDGTGMGVFIPSERPDAESVARLSEELQEWEIEELAAAGRSATWPECPDHPNSHPLEPIVDDRDVAVWRCPRAGHVICEIGTLGSYR
jgi:hypothetical protein